MHPHLAGTKPNSDTALFLLKHFTSLNLKTHTTSYKTLLSYPLHSSLSSHFKNGSFSNLPLTEPSEPGSDMVHAYHAYSPSGSVYAKPVFVNYGRDKDYRSLGSIGVNVKGCIVIVRKGGGLGRSTVVEKAEKNGAAAVLIYNDEVDTWRNGFERGHVMKGVGDPLSPGWGSVDGSERLSLDDNEVLERFPKIPSMPISVDVADAVLSSLGESMVPLEWRS
ncbi:putative glutamate carboxypeptidase, partial [Trifolium medium]|nr:putative glutamate carboxypeptidase [Trifolium medium]